MGAGSKPAAATGQRSGRYLDHHLGAVVWKVQREPRRAAGLAVDEQFRDLPEPVSGAVKEVFAACGERKLKHGALVAVEALEDLRELIRRGRAYRPKPSGEAATPPGLGGDEGAHLTVLLPGG